MEAASSSSGSAPGLRGLVDPVARRIVACAADLALVVDRGGTIVDLWLGDAFRDQKASWEALIGQRWIDTVPSDSRNKVDQLVRDTFAEQSRRAREINQNVGAGEVPLRFSGALVDDGHVVALGHDLRPIAELQQRMVSAQQAMEVEYRRLRQADTRYRVLFHVSAEGALIARGDERKVVDANPSAVRLLGQPADALRQRTIFDLFDAPSQAELTRLIGAVETGGELEVELRRGEGNSVALRAAASMFRESGANLLLLRFWPVSDEPQASPRNARMLGVLEAMPDGFVVTGEDRRILSANGGFCEIVQRASEAQVIGKPLDRWVGRPGVDLNIVIANLRERGVVRGFSTVIRGDFGGDQEAVLTAVSALDGKVPCFGFSIRPLIARAAEAPAATILGQPAEQLRALVGRVSLKEIIRESADLIEKLCIEAALDVSGNNRAAAAQLLGLSRQSLYSKMRRYGLADFEPT